MSVLPLPVTLRWVGEVRFAAESRGVSLTLDGDGAAGPSPMQALAMALAGCMAIDVVAILQKGRHPIAGLEVRLEAGRAETPPRAFTRVALHCVVRGDVPPQAVARAIELSRDRYCSVWHSMRQDIAFETSFEVAP